MLTQQQMQTVILEHVEAENANDPARMLATCSREAPVMRQLSIIPASR